MPRPHARDDGFTLIELLVVVIIMGILAAISIPVFLRQRQAGYDAQIVNDLRNAATLIESVAVENNGVYTAGSLDTFIPTSGVVTLDDIGAGGNSFCLTATSNGQTRIWDSTNGGIQPTGTVCP